jgi:hypothetical protein
MLNGLGFRPVPKPVILQLHLRSLGLLVLTSPDDVRSVVKNPRLRLDREYLRHWTERLGLQGELHYVLQTAGSEQGK